jgi:hypothetical protein
MTGSGLQEKPGNCISFGVASLAGIIEKIIIICVMDEKKLQKPVDSWKLDRHLFLTSKI